MTEVDLRALVREAVERHLGRAACQAGPAVPVPPVPEPHVTHRLYVAIVNTTDQCHIEPSSPCDHCGYCKTHGF